MIKHTVKYRNYDNEDVEKEFWFNLDEGEIALLELSKKEGLSEWLRVAQENEDPTIVGPAFEKIVLSAVGRREGEKFIKDQDAIDNLRWSGAYSALILWMLQNPIESADFVNGMLPAAAQEAIKNDKSELVAKMKAKTEEMAIPVTVAEEPVEVEMPAEAPSALPTMTTETPDFSAMSPEQFEEWKNNQG